MAQKDTDATQEIVIEKSKRLINFNEFIHSTTLRVEEIAGFRAYSKDKLNRSREDWNSTLLEYKNRDLKEG